MALTWQFITEKGQPIDLDAPFLEGFVTITKTVSNRGKTVVVSSILTTSLEGSTFFGISIKDSIYTYLRGGSVYCMPRIIRSKDVFLPSKFLTMPMDRPSLQPCSHSTVYAIDSDRCADLKIEQDINVPSPLTRQRRQYSDSRYSPEEAGAPFGESRVHRNGLGRTHVQGGKEIKGKSAVHPYVVSLGSIGAMLLVTAVAMPLVIFGFYAKKKCKFRSDCCNIYKKSNGNKGIKIKGIVT